MIIIRAVLLLLSLLLLVMAGYSATHLGVNADVLEFAMVAYLAGIGFSCCAVAILMPNPK